MEGEGEGDGDWPFDTCQQLTVLCSPALRHPEPLERPDFTQIDCFLTRKDEELLWVVPESSEDVHPQARVIGTELVCGRNLYPTLQASYYSTA